MVPGETAIATSGIRCESGLTTDQRKQAMTETTVSEQQPLVTFINVFTVEPDRQGELLAVLTTASDQVMRHLPGVHLR